MSTTTSRPSPTIENPADAAAQGAGAQPQTHCADTLVAVPTQEIRPAFNWRSADHHPPQERRGLAHGIGWLLFDALESLVNLAAATMALFLIGVAERPPDEEHTFGHTKAEYFSSGIVRCRSSWWRLSGLAGAPGRRALNPQPLENIGIGLLVAVVASAINLGVALTLLRAGRTYRSITLEADAQAFADRCLHVGRRHCCSWIGLCHGLVVLDPIIGLLVAINIVWSGVQLVRRSAQWPHGYSTIRRGSRGQIDQTLQPFRRAWYSTPCARVRWGTRRFMSVHVLMPGVWTIQHGHEVADSIETALTQAMPGMVASTHLEPLEY